MAMISIDGVDLPAPIVFELPRFDLDSSDTSRNELGVMQRDRVRQGIYKLVLGWAMITSSELQTIEMATKPASLQVTFPTPGGFVTKNMYVGDRNTKINTYHDVHDFIKWDISFNLIEY